MSLTESTATSPRSSQSARVVLWSAVVAFAVSQFLSPLEGENTVGWYFSDWGNWIDSLWTSVLNGNIDWPAAIGLMLTTTLLAGLIAIPLLAEWLRKARPILWILRFLTLGGLALFALVMYRYWQITQSLAQKMMREPVGIPFLAGFWVFLAALVVNAIGLWMIPKAVKQLPFNGPEIPNHGGVLMNADGNNAPAGANSSGRLAKAVLWLAVGLFLVSQFLPFTADDRRVGWYFRDWGISFQEAWSSARPGSADWLGNMGLVGGGFLVFLFILAIIVGSPWIMGFLKRARPLLWIVRCLMLGLAGLIAFLIYWVMALIDLNHYMGVTVQFPSPKAGIWVFLAALVVNTIGLWMIPKAVKRQASEEVDG